MGQIYERKCFRGHPQQNRRHGIFPVHKLRRRPYPALHRILGCQVTSLDIVPDGMVGKSFNGGNYIKTTTRGDLTKGLIVNEWSRLWELDLERIYTADFEAFGEKARNPVDAEVDFFIAVK